MIHVDLGLPSGEKWTLDNDKTDKRNIDVNVKMLDGSVYSSSQIRKFLNKPKEFVSRFFVNML